MCLFVSVEYVGILAFQKCVLIKHYYKNKQKDIIKNTLYLAALYVNFKFLHRNKGKDYNHLNVI